MAKCIVGLGNPGDKYKNNRHNVGFKVVKSFLNDQIVSEVKFKKHSRIYKGSINDAPFYVLMPQTYMNLSGDSVRAFVKFYNIDVDDILVVYDDMDFDFGQIKLKPKGSAGGHNGVGDIINKLGTNVIKRVRIGIGRPDRKSSVTNYVLSDFSKDEAKLLDDLYKITNNIIEDFILDKSFDKLMSEYNNKKFI